MAKKQSQSDGAKTKKSPHVPGQYWGYSLQAVRFLSLLMEPAAAGFVSLEVIQDVARDDGLGSVLLSETKSGLTQNPVGDRSVDLWKTLDNWLRSVESGEIDPDNTIFEIFVGRRHDIGAIPNILRAASTNAAAAEAIEAAREALWGPPPDYAKHSSLPDSLKQYSDAFLTPGNPTAVKVTRNFQISFPSASNPLDDLRTIALHKYIRTEVVDDLIKYAHGWVKERIDTLIQEQKPAVISVQEFDRAMAAFIPRLYFQQVLLNFASEPTVGEIQAERLRVYVRQLGLVEAGEEEVLEAINAYLRASVMRSKWAEDGVIHEDSFAEYADALVMFWRNKRRQNELAYKGLTSSERGRLLLSHCNEHKETLQGLQVPPYFAPGSYHALADELEVGWHPEYMKHLSEAAPEHDR